MGPPRAMPQTAPTTVPEAPSTLDSGGATSVVDAATIAESIRLHTEKLQELKRQQAALLSVYTGAGSSAAGSSEPTRQLQFGDLAAIVCDDGGASSAGGASNAERAPSSEHVSFEGAAGGTW